MNLFSSATTFLLWLLLAATSLHAQREARRIDSLYAILQQEGGDSACADLLSEIGYEYHFRLSKFDSALVYYQNALPIARRLKNPSLQFKVVNRMANVHNKMGNYAGALQLALQNLKHEEQIHDTTQIFYTKREIMWVYGSIGDNQKVLELSKALNAFAGSGYFKDPKRIQVYRHIAYNNLSDVYLKLGRFDSALYYRQGSYQNLNPGEDPGNKSVATSGLARIYKTMGNLDSAFCYNTLTLRYAAAGGRADILMDALLNMATLYQKKGVADSAFFYARQALQAFRNAPDTSGIMRATLLVSDLYKSRRQFDSAYTYLSYYTALKDSASPEDKIKKVETLLFNENLRQKQMEQEQKEARQAYTAKVKLYSLLAGIGVLLLVAALLWRNNRQKQKAHQKIERAYAELKATQAQLIQSEKMASLGELTAGIAHEIQNPLNFVNNFSEVNTELIDELKQELDRANMVDLKTLVGDIIANERKINEHGRRADAIVKSMLQHSRSAKGERQPTDINALCDEYLRLSYHGLRAKDKAFNATIKTEFSSSIAKIDVVPQDIGRVLLNLFNNAFYAVHEKKKTLGESYEPIISVSTKKLAEKIEIVVQDNGMGISKSVVDKIFQPFFTTKPTGQGTGLGLSLSYDIIKAHGGELKVKTTEGNGAMFIVLLPV